MSVNYELPITNRRSARPTCHRPPPYPALTALTDLPRHTPPPPRHSRESGNPHPSLPPRRATTAGVLDSGLRRNDGGEYVGIRHCLPRNHHTLRPSTPSFPPLNPVIPAPNPVIPAKAGIHTSSRRPAGPLLGFWILAYARMTVGSMPPIQYYLPRNRHTQPPPYPPPTVIPAKAGIHTPACRHAGPPPPGFWIPAYAGMTVGSMPPSGITYPATPYPAPQSPFPPPLRHSRESGNPHPSL